MVAMTLSVEEYGTLIRLNKSWFNMLRISELGMLTLIKMIDRECDLHTDTRQIRDV